MSMLIEDRITTLRKIRELYEKIENEIKIQTILYNSSENEKERDRHSEEIRAWYWIFKQINGLENKIN